MSEVIETYRGSPVSKGEDRHGREVVWGRVLRELEQGKMFGAWDFAKAADLSRRSAQRHIARLLGEGKIVRKGAGRATQYGLRF
jgi:hypothetical protein